MSQLSTQIHDEKWPKLKSVLNIYWFSHFLHDCEIFSYIYAFTSQKEEKKGKKRNKEDKKKTAQSHWNRFTAELVSWRQVLSFRQLLTYLEGRK